MTRATEHQPTSLYRLYDASDVLLYVGIAGNPGRRFEQHRGEKPWWGEVARIMLEHFPSREAALAAESKAIKADRPRYNIAGQTGPRIVVPDWDHRPLANGAYLDIESRDGYVYVGINRDDLVVQLRMSGHPWQVPRHILDATSYLADVALLWLLADGCGPREGRGQAGSRFRNICVRPAFMRPAAKALIASEVRGDVEPLIRFASRLIRAFPKPNRKRSELDHLGEARNVFDLMRKHTAPPRPEAVA